MEVITLRQQDFSKKCNELLNKIDFSADIVLGILNGGGYVISELEDSDYLKRTNYMLIKQQRDNNFKKKLIIENVLKLLPYKVTNWLRVLESKQAEKSIKKLDQIELSKFGVDLRFIHSLEKPINTILILDDAIDTGKTIYVIKNNLSRMFPNAIVKIAVLSWTLGNSIIKPDYYIYKDVLVRFPWSKDYKGKDFEKKSFSS